MDGAARGGDQLGREGGGRGWPICFRHVASFSVFSFIIIIIIIIYSVDSALPSRRWFLFSATGFFCSVLSVVPCFALVPGFYRVLWASLEFYRGFFSDAGWADRSTRTRRMGKQLSAGADDEESERERERGVHRRETQKERFGDGVGG